jgi:hypothetical protein
MQKEIKTFTATIYLSGDIAVIKQVCRKYCLKGLCVTVKPTLFIYTGGEEFGVEIGLINYPRFEDSEDNILQKTIELANQCRDEAMQHSWLIVTAEKTIWNTLKQ